MFSIKYLDILSTFINTSVLLGPYNGLVICIFSRKWVQATWPDACSVRADAEASEQVSVSVDV